MPSVPFALDEPEAAALYTLYVHERALSVSMTSDPLNWYLKLKMW